jgi:hypothetical protein
MRKSPISKSSFFAKRTVVRSESFHKGLPPIQIRQDNIRRSLTLPSSKILDILPSQPPPCLLNKVTLTPRPLILPLKKSISSKSYNTTATSLKIRFKNIDIYSKKIPQEDFMIFMLDKIPTFDFVREKNLLRKRKKLLKDVVTIIEEDQEHYCFE